MTRGPYDVVAGTGHRELLRGDPAWVRDQLAKACVWLRDVKGTRYAVSGLALEFDMDWAEAALTARLELCVAIPFEEQAAKWKPEQQERWRRIRAAATSEKVLGGIPPDLPPKYRSSVVNSLMAARDRFMVDHAGTVITDWEPGRLFGGTTNTLIYAAERRKRGIHLDPVARAVRHALPALADLKAFTLVSTACKHIAMVDTRARVDARLAGLHAAGFDSWKVRAAKPYETCKDSCADCIEQLAHGALAGSLGAVEPVGVLATPVP